MWATGGLIGGPNVVCSNTSSRKVAGNDLCRRADRTNAPGLEQHRTICEITHGCNVVAHEQYRPSPLTRKFAHFSQAFFLKLSVPHGKNFVDNQDFGIK